MRWDSALGGSKLSSPYFPSTSTREVAQGETLVGNMPTDPVKSGYIFVGWFVDFIPRT